jgi:Flp pilus assembly protein CpaB
MRELIVVVLGVLLMMFGLASLVAINNEKRCTLSWEHSDHQSKYEYGICLVSIDGKWIPSDNVKISLEK